MTDDQRSLIAKWIEHSKKNAAECRLPRSPLSEAIEACLLEVDAWREREHQRRWGQWEASMEHQQKVAEQ